ncbi:hypothetical protein F4677DRAFT_194458 [Hypoxylon crocopeplum]|nr:hypothetical protein F4677DRAFT_194458 [Hypoxylon crocopeplum]
MEALRGASPPKNPAGSESPEQLLDSFKAAALSVTKLYKTSAAAQARARSEGYQDCLDDLLAFLDKSSIGLCDGEGWQIRKWATERLDGRETASQSLESEDEVEKPEPASSPEIYRSGNQAQVTPMANEVYMQHMQHDATPAPTHQTTAHTPADESQAYTVPTQENFTFRSTHPYPQESYPNLESLALSDSARATNDNTAPGSSTVPIAHAARSRNNKRGARPRPMNHLGRGAGQKRPVNWAEFFPDVAFGKNPFEREGKRNRHN